MNDKYNRKIKGVTVDVYDVLKAFDVTCPALQHLIKKALCAGLRGHKNREQDLRDIVDSALRAQFINDEENIIRQQEELVAESEQLAKGPGFKCGGFISNDYQVTVGVKGHDHGESVPLVRDMTKLIHEVLKKQEPIDIDGKGDINIAGDITINITVNPEEVQHMTGPTTESINELIRDSIKTACKPGGVLHSK